MLSGSTFHFKRELVCAVRSSSVLSAPFWTIGSLHGDTEMMSVCSAFLAALQACRNPPLCRGVQEPVRRSAWARLVWIFFVECTHKPCHAMCMGAAGWRNVRELDV